MIGRVVIMHYDNDKVKLNEKETQQYKEKLIGKCFAVLGIYEDCEKDNQFTSFITYIDRLKRELAGYYINSNDIQLISIVNILTEMQELNELTQSRVKSLTFYIISVVQKIKEV